ncbi:hypothetical protein [Brachybacterium tyrofermentans]|uniref:hypothetical protein n=1 Tax=Brachybacterium tyrofermentans TaxID=47848 RepID=UPI003F90C37C
MIVIGNKGITLIVGVLVVATMLVAYSSLVSGNDKVTVTLVGVLVALLVAELLRSRLRRQALPDEDADARDGAEQAE